MAEPLAASLAGGPDPGVLHVIADIMRTRSIVRPLDGILSVS